MSRGTLPQRRYLALLPQLAAELGDGWQSELARRWGVVPSLIQKQHAGTRMPGQKVIDAAIKDLRLDARFFYDAALSASPDYREFVAGVSRVERDASTAVTDFLEQMGDSVAPEHAAVLRSIDFGGVVPTVMMIARFEAALRAGEAGRAIPAQVIAPPPIPEGARRLPKKPPK